MNPDPLSLTAKGRALARSLRHLTTITTLALGLASSRADFLQPVGVTVSNGEELSNALIDGQGFEDPGVGTADSVHTSSASEMWSSIGSIRAEVVFDLGQSFDLTKIYIWNYSAGADTDRGMKDVQVYVSSDANPATARFTGIANFTLQEGGDKAQVFDLVGTEVRFVKIKNTSNWGNGYSIGLAEVRFETGNITGSVPTVAINGLKDGDVVPLGSALSLSATVTDRDNDLAKVEFFDGTTKLDEKNKAPFTATLSSLTAGDHLLRVVATDASGKVGWQQVAVVVREVIPGKVIQIDDQRDIGTGQGQIRYSGGWNLAQGNAADPRFLNNDHYTDAKGNFFEVKFVGVKIDVFATVASHHGNGIATIDGGTQYTINYKAAQRAEQKLVWSSPLLPNREHVLRVTVAGNGVVTADRFDVTQSDAPSDDRASVKKWVVTLPQLEIQLEDLGTSKVDTNTVSLTVDGTAVPSTVSKVGGLTTLRYNPPAPFAPGSQHTFTVAAKDTLGNAVGSSAPFVVPSPPFPLTGLGEPPATAGNWSVRQVWAGGRADAVATAVGIAQSVGQPGFAGQVRDVQSPVVNFTFSPSPGNSGLFGDDLTFPAEPDGLPAADWITVARAKVRIPRSGDWTIGAHTDDGFCLRFVGHPFDSVSGNGDRDDQFPEYMLFAVGTGDSNTRGVLKDLPAGDYVVEFIHFQRNGGAAVELYATEGVAVEDSDSASWALIGAPDGLQLVADTVPGPDLKIVGLRVENGTVVMDLVSPTPNAAHVLVESANLKTWQPAIGVEFFPTGGFGLRATVANPATSPKFYRVQLAP